MSTINEDVIFLFAAKHYENVGCDDVEEFYNDLNIVIHLKKLFTRFHINKDLKERLIINHLISFYNVFSPHAATRILFHKIDPIHHAYLKSFLTYLNLCPDLVLDFENRLINLNTLELNQTIMDVLKRNVG